MTQVGNYWGRADNTDTEYSTQTKHKAQGNNLKSGSKQLFLCHNLCSRSLKDKIKKGMEQIDVK